MFSSLIPQPLSAHLGKMEPVSDQDRSLLNSQIGITGTLSTNAASHGVQNVGEIGPMQSNAGLQIPLLPTKRKAAAEFTVLDKHRAPLNSTRLSQQSGLTNKRMMRNESMSNRIVSPRVQTPKSKATPPEVSPKTQHGSYQAVRMKMRETLAAALSVGNQDIDIVPNVDKSTLQESGNTAGEVIVLGSTTVDAAPDMVSEERPQFSYVMPDMDDTFGNTFFAKDDLLQGNGLSWTWDMEVAKLTEAQTDEIINLDEKNLSGNGIGQMLCSPQELAVKVELELYKLFGGVNKKYKEKGRSLMFNLKDPNNPKLREKVLSSEITPERLCSMTPEELASKELSEWRMAKAEEFDKMIVLPDSDIDMRRLVRKTHKGEFQVEVDQVDDGVSAEVFVGSSSLTQFREKTKTECLSPLGDVVKEKMVDSSNLTISTDVTDFMQEIIVDESKDEGSLPTIVSFEFMESLDSEPPFEDLPEDGKEMQVQPDKDNLETGGEGNEKASSETTSVNSTEAKTVTNNDKSNIKITEALSSLETIETSAEPFGGSIGICLWEGDLQLTLSSSVPVIGVFKSGEKTSTKEWPGSVEIKGRVRFAAFEKFLQELPMSRTRAVMVVHFVLKDASSLVHQASLSEVMASYLADERVGFGEPNPGVEVYFCPPHKRTTETLSRLLFRDQTDVIESPQLGLIGVVVWRRAHSSAILPNSHSQHKHHRKHLSSRRRDNINAITNSNIISKSLSLLPQSNNGSVDDGDDVPPGFGPGIVNQDEDDLPEFSFPKGSNSSWQTLPAQSSMTSTVPPTRPVGHMRHLVYQYGETNNTTALASKTQTGTESRHWNQNDIPEWKPRIQNGHGLEVPNHMHLANQVRPTGQDMTPFMPIQQPVNLMQNCYVQMPIPHGLPPNAFVPGQYYGGQCRQG